MAVVKDPFGGSGLRNLGQTVGNNVRSGIPNHGNLGSLIDRGVTKAATVANQTRQPSAPATGSVGASGYSALQNAYGAQQGNYLAALTQAIQAQQAAREEAIAAANAALDKSAGLARDRYKTSKKEIAGNYQDLKNQASVNNFKAKRNQREALADRGALGSGSAMQENIRLAANFNNGMNKIGSQENMAYENLLNNLNQYLAQIDQQKAANMASGLNGYNNALSSLINASFSGYTPDQGYADLAASLMNSGAPGTQMNAVQGQNAVLGNNLYDILLRQYGM